MPIFKVCGQVCHRMGSLLPIEGETLFSTYILGDEPQQESIKCNKIRNTKLSFVLKLQNILHWENKYVKEFEMAMDHARAEDFKVVIHANRSHRELERRYYVPQTPEVTIVMVGQEFHHRVIILHL